MTRSNNGYFMRRYALLLVLGVAAASSACGDPIVILGESPGTVRNIAGVGDSAGTRVDSLATRTKLINTTAVAFNDQTLKLYFADRAASTTESGLQSPAARIFSVTSAGHITLELDAGCGGGGAICTLEVTDMTFGPPGTLIIADAQRNRVTSFNVDTHVQTNIAGTAAPSAAVEGAAAQTSPISAPSGVAYGADGTIYISEANSGRVLSVGSNGLYHVIAGGGTQQVSSSPATATAAHLSAPNGLAIHDGTLYIADRDQHMVYALDLAAAQIEAVAGIGIAGFSGDGGDADAAQLNTPRDVAVSTDGNTLYISDSNNNRVRAVNLTSHTIVTYIGNGSTAYNGERRAAGDTALRNPLGLAVSALGFLFVADQGHSLIRRIATGL
jgi:sugar lactone lactonase YvrE